jgi:hypothetical protein
MPLNKWNQQEVFQRLIMHLLVLWDYEIASKFF